ncbi:protein phosphatase 2C domain-containing protein [Patescibacteria group bacterium]|nr:protein phosphatase 2C domain-containing protein [Patescibacteria group bacterium]
MCAFEILTRGNGSSGLIASLSQFTLACGYTVLAGTDRGVGYSDVNQDCIGIDVENNRIVVADGLGSDKDSELAAKLAVECILKGQKSFHEVQKEFCGLINGADRTGTLANGFSGQIEGDTCLIALEIQEIMGQFKKLSIAQAGDVKLIVVRPSVIYNPIFTTVDQTVAQEAYDSGEIKDKRQYYCSFSKADSNVHFLN